MAEGTADSGALMRRMTEEIWNQGRVVLVDELIAEDLIDHVDIPRLDGAGRARYRASVEMTRAAFSDFLNPVDFIVADGDLAVSVGRNTGTHDGDLMGLPPTGQKVDYAVVGILRFRDGRAVERWGVADTMTMMSQLGLLG